MKPLLVVAALVLTGCAPSGYDGECSAWVRFDENMYQSHNEMPDQAPLGSSVGEGDIVGCGDEDAPAVDRVEVFRIKGVEPDVAVAVRGSWRGLYIREDLAADRTSWPDPLQP